MTYCQICKKKEATILSSYQILGGFNFCDLCYFEIINRFKYYIGSKEVTKEEWEKFLEGK